MSQTDESKTKRLARMCPQCGTLYDPSLAFCPNDGSKLSQNLVSTNQLLLHVSERDTGGKKAKQQAAPVANNSVQPMLATDGNGRELIGKILDDRYELQSVIGSGGMSIVYRARDIALRKTIAVKMLLPHMLIFPMALQRFQQEAQAASNLSHPNVVTIYSFGASSGHAYIAMDYLEGRSLSNLLEEHKGLPVDRAIHIFMQVADALSHAHSKGVIHRDLKPSNIILVQNGNDPDYVKIVDFGIAKLLHQEGPEAVQLTQTGEIFGSPVYMSPEQCKGEKLDARADVYSLGCLMYESLVGKPPHNGNTTLEVLYKHTHDVPPPLARGKIKFPQRLERIVFKTLAKNPAERYQSMALLHKDLNSLSKERRFGILATIKDKLELFWLKRRPKTVHEKAIASVCVLLSMVVLGLGTWIVHLYWSAMNSPANKIALEWEETQNTIEIPEAQLQSALLKVAVISDQSDPTERVKLLFANDGVFMKAGRWQQALDRIGKDYVISKQINGTDAFITVMVEDALAECYYRVGQFDSAKRYYENFLGMSRQHPQPAQMIARSYSIYGQVCLQQGDLVKAEDAFKHAITLWNDQSNRWTTWGTNTELNLALPTVAPSDEFALVVARLGDIALFRKQYPEAIHYYSKAIDYWDPVAESARADIASDIGQKYYMDSIVNDAIAHDRLARAQLNDGSSNLATKTASTAVTLMTKARGGNNAYTALVVRDNSDILWHSGDYANALMEKYKAISMLAKAD